MATAPGSSAFPNKLVHHGQQRASRNGREPRKGDTASFLTAPERQALKRQRAMTDTVTEEGR